MFTNNNAFTMPDDINRLYIYTLLNTNLYVAKYKTAAYIKTRREELLSDI